MRVDASFFVVIVLAVQTVCSTDQDWRGLVDAIVQQSKQLSSKVDGLRTELSQLQRDHKQLQHIHDANEQKYERWRRETNAKLQSLVGGGRRRLSSSAVSTRRRGLSSADACSDPSGPQLLVEGVCSCTGGFLVEGRNITKALDSLLQSTITTRSTATSASTSTATSTSTSTSTSTAVASTSFFVSDDDFQVNVRTVNEHVTSTLLIDPSTATNHQCPGDLESNTADVGWVCMRPPSSAASTAGATYVVQHDVASLAVDATIWQQGASEAFRQHANDDRLLSGIYVDGVSIRVTRSGQSAAEHVFSVGVGLTTNVDGTYGRDYNCPLTNCGYPNQANCQGRDPPTFVGNAFWCDSGNTATSYSHSTLYKRKIHASYSVTSLNYTAGDTIEVAVMLDQRSDNEDVYVSNLTLVLRN